MSAYRPLLALLLISTLPACATGKAVRAGRSAEAVEQPVSAAEAYLDALDRRPGHKKAGEGLDRTAEGACFALLLEAERLEKAGEWAGAAQAYEGLSAFLARQALRSERELAAELAPVLSREAAALLIAQIDNPARIADPTDVPELAVK